MRPDLPWNVAGIPSEARDAARAAARREGLSVGEWLTRRIVRDLTGANESVEPMRETFTHTPPPSYRAEASLEPRPEPSSFRAQSDDMLARVARNESETQDIYKRIESHLGGLGRRLEATERSTQENSRAMSQAATEINIAAREQAQAFDQLSAHVVNLAGRLERVEKDDGSASLKQAQALDQLSSHLVSLSSRLDRLEKQDDGSAGLKQAQALDQLSSHLVSLSNRLDQIERADHSGGNENLKDAVKTLHQGLSRLADQISSTSKQSATQIEAVAANLDAVAARVADVRTSGEGAARTMEQRMAMLDERVRVVERVAHSSADALDKALENMESRQMARADETAEIHRRVGSVEHLNNALDRLTQRFTASEAQAATSIARMEDSVLRLESRGSDPAIDRRLNSIERTLGDIVARFDGAASTDETLRRISQRLDSIEDRAEHALEEARDAKAAASAPQPAATVTSAAPPLAPEPSVYEPEPVYAAPTPIPSFADTSSHGPVFDAPPFPEPPPVNSKPDPFGEAFAPVFAPPPHAADTTAASVFGDLGAATTLGPQPVFESAFTPSSAPPPPVTNESFLAAARRSAQAAAATAQADRSKGFGGFGWGANAANPVEPATVTASAAPAMMAPPVVVPETGDDKPAKSNTTRYLLIAAGALVLILAIASIILSQNAGVSQAEKHTGIGALFNSKKTAEPATTTTEVPYTPQDQTQTGAAAQPPAAAAPGNDSFSAVPPKPVTAPAANAPTPPQQAEAKPATALDKLTAAANAGNAKAEMLIGLKYVDGDGVPANEAEGAKWLQKAASQNEPVAAYRLGTLYERGKGVTADPAKATKWYQVAAQAGNRKAMHNLAVAFAQGTGVQKNFAEAARWFSKAAALGLSDSQFNLAVLYERGLGVPQSLLDAYKWYAIAASQGDTESKNRIDALGTQLSADDRAAAARSAQMFKPQALDRRANATPDANDITH
jgi:localization factor PodJL